MGMEENRGNSFTHEGITSPVSRVKTHREGKEDKRGSLFIKYSPCLRIHGGKTLEEDVWKVGDRRPLSCLVNFLVIRLMKNSVEDEGRQSLSCLVNFLVIRLMENSVEDEGRQSLLCVEHVDYSWLGREIEENGLYLLMLDRVENGGKNSLKSFLLEVTVDSGEQKKNKKQTNKKTHTKRQKKKDFKIIRGKLPPAGD